MPSKLSWIDHDPLERERMTHILALFSQRESRDELGIGAIRDSLSDSLFPGVSMIMTRLRYVFFVPWIYRELEAEGTSSMDVARKARAKETRLIQPLLDERELGVLGRLARGSLKRLPSSVYWNALVSWGLFRPGWSQSGYHLKFDALKRRRSASTRADDQDLSERALETWHHGLPKPPPEYPDKVSFALTREEALYLSDRIVESQPHSLLAWLVAERAPVDANDVWAHPLLGRMRPEHRELLEHARLFSEVMYGAALLYNAELARVARHQELLDEHEANLQLWHAKLASQGRIEAARRWDLNRFWFLVAGGGHTITRAARTFCKAWVALTARNSFDDVVGADARERVRDRERSLKKTQSRFDNARARDQWSGYAGLIRLSYRWSIVKTLLTDLNRPLENADAAA